MDLSSKWQYQDASILNFIFSLTIDPYHIFSLSYEYILSKDQIQYWDYKISPKNSIYLYYDLWSDINIIKNIKSIKKVNVELQLELWLTKLRFEESL